MSASIKATCPNCRKLIRIPLDWSDRAMKCKKCGTLVQMKKKDAAPTAVAEATAPAPAIPTTTVPTYEPNYDPPAQPQPQMAYPPQPAYAPPPSYEAPPLPYGYPSPYPMPPQYGAAPQYAAPPAYGYPQPPAYGYPQPQPQYAPPPEPQFAPPPPSHESTFPSNDDVGPSRRKYNRGGGNAAQKVVMFAILAVVLGGAVLIGMKMSNRFTDGGSQAKIDEPKRHTGKGPEPVDNTKAGTGSTPGMAPGIVSDPFPRRMLFIHVAKYVYFNNLSPGVYGRGEDLPTATASRMAFEFRIPTDGANNQLFVLSDSSGKPAPPMLKNVLLQTFEQFFTTSREQDRVIVYFSGHAREVDGKAYLVPVDGDPDDVATLLPLDEVYARLAACKAQQKVMLWDVCRFNPGVGSARAGSELMSEKLQTALHAVPPGVQVLTSCSTGQNAQETSTGGSEFLAAFNDKLKQLKSSGASTPATPGQPIPTEKWSDSLRESLARKRDGALSQTVRATVPPLTTDVAYVKDAPPAARFAWPFVAPGANPGDVEKLLALLELPGIRKEIELPAGLAAVYPFSAEVMKAYADDGGDDKAPIRKATLEAMAYIRDQWKFGDGGGLRETLNGAADEATKKRIQEEEQKPIAKLTLELEDHMVALELSGKKIAEEKSKRWQGLHAYALAQVQMRWAFVQEYNGALGTIRTDNLEKPTGTGTPVYRLISVEKMKSKKDITEKVDAARETFEKLGKDHKGTPLEILAKMNKNVSLGLAWKLETQQEPGADAMEKKE